MNSADITELVLAAGDGNAAALHGLFEAVYNELKRLAHRQLAGALNPTINTTGLVHETYLKLVRPESLKLKDRGHFFAMAAKAMHQIVIDHARRRHAGKRGGAQVQVTNIDEDIDLGGLDPETLINLHAALERLQELEPSLSELVELRFFAGLSVEQVAELREVSTRTVLRDWRRARAFLFDPVHPTQAS